MAASPIHLALDLTIILIVAGFGTYGFRSFLLLLKAKELKDMGRLWLPVLTSGLVFIVWSVEDLVFDAYGGFGEDVNSIVTDLTLLAAVLLFSVGVVRFSRIWLEYAKKRDETLREKYAT